MSPVDWLAPPDSPIATSAHLANRDFAPMHPVKQNSPRPGKAILLDPRTEKDKNLFTKMYLLLCKHVSLFLALWVFACASRAVDPIIPYTAFDYSTYLPRRCEPSTAPLFQDSSPNDVFEAEIISNFDLLNNAPPTDAPQKGVLRYVDSQERTRYVGILPRVSGNLRSHCEFKPLRLEFESEEVMSRVVTAETKDDAPLKEIYEQYLKTDGLALGKKGIAQEKNVFANLGDDIKIVSHCGVHNWDRLGGKDIDAQRAHLLQEYYAYRLLSLVGATTFETRLAELTFRNADGTLIGKFPAFFKEPKSEMAARCGLRVDKNQEGEVSKISYLSFHLKNFLVMNEDFDFPAHNVCNLRSEDGVRHLVPHDFDLSELSNPQYESLKSEVIARFSAWLEQYRYDDIALTQVIYLLSYRDDFEATVRHSMLDDKSKNRTLDWLESALGYLRIFVYERPPKELEHMEEIRASLIAPFPT